MGDTVAIRLRDLTPTADRAYAALYPEHAVLGGAAQLLAFVRTELMPWVAARYEIDETDASYFGHSMGGLFGTFVMLQEPATFARYIVGSPSFWWDHAGIFDLEERYARDHDDLRAKVFFGVGGDETQDGRVRESVRLPPAERITGTSWYIDMVELMTRMVDRLGARGYPGLEMQSQVFAGEFHITVPLMTLGSGLRWVFDAPR